RDASPRGARLSSERARTWGAPEARRRQGGHPPEVVAPRQRSARSGALYHSRGRMARAPRAGREPATPVDSLSDEPVAPAPVLGAPAQPNSALLFLFENGRAHYCALCVLCVESLVATR